MKYRRWIAVLEWSLLAAVIAVHLALWYAEPWLGAVPGSVGSLLAEAAPFARGTLLILVTVWGPGHPGWRVFPAIIVALMILDQNLWADGLGVEHTRLLFDSVCTLTFAAALGSRVAGLRIVRASVGSVDQGGAKFSIRMLLIATTVVAVLVAGATWMRPYFAAEIRDVTPWESLLSVFPDEFSLADFVRWGAMTGSVVGIAVAAVVAVLRPGVVWMRMLLLLVVAPLAGVYVSWLTASGIDTAATFAALLATLALLIAGSVVPLRLLDFRLVRPVYVRKSNAPAAQSAPLPACQEPRIPAPLETVR